MSEAVMSKTPPRARYIVFAVIVLLTMGLIYAWSIFVKPLENEFGWERSQTSTIFTVNMICFTAGNILSGTLIKRLKPRRTLWLAGVLVAAGFILTTTINSLMLFFVFYGLCGFGVGVAYNAVLATVGTWFPDKRGLINGIMLTSFGFSTLLFSGIVNQIIIAAGWRMAFIILGAISGAVALIFGGQLKYPDEGTVFPEPAKKIAKYAEIPDKDYTPAEMIRTRSFWMMELCGLFNGCVGLAFVGHAATMSSELSIASGLSDSLTASLAALTVSAFSLGNGFGKLTAGVMFDRLGRKRTMGIIVGCLLLGIFSMTGLYMKGLSVPFTLAAIVLSFSYGGSSSFSPNIAPSFFGMKNYAINFAVINIGMGILGPIIGTAMIGGLYMRTGDYSVALFVLCGYAVVSLAAFLLLKSPTELKESSSGKQKKGNDGYV